jgi:hypothetical protein
MFRFYPCPPRVIRGSARTCIQLPYLQSFISPEALALGLHLSVARCQHIVYG